MLPQDDAEDGRCLARMRAGDEGAFDQLFRRYYGPLVGLAESLVQNRAQAEEVVQDVMLELWRRRETLQITDTVRAYLFRSSRNRALNELRRARVAKRGEPYARGEELTLPTAHADLVHEELEQAIRSALDALSPPIRETFDLSRTEGLRYAEIAERLGLSVKTVEARMGRALKELRASLAEWLPEGG